MKMSASRDIFCQDQNSVDMPNPLIYPDARSGSKGHVSDPLDPFRAPVPSAGYEYGKAITEAVVNIRFPMFNVSRVLSMHVNSNSLDPLLASVCRFEEDLKQQDLLLYSADEVPEEDVAKLEERVKGHVQFWNEKQRFCMDLEKEMNDLSAKHVKMRNDYHKEIEKLKEDCRKLSGDP
jgi:hypothetical protein